MFEFVRKHTRILQFVLVLLIFPSFVFFGIQGYSRFGEGSHSTVAKVDGHDITQVEWDQAYRQQVERVRQQMPNVDVKLFDTPQMKQSVLEGLVRERVMLTAATKLNLMTTDDRLQRLFLADPQFASYRRPDGTVNTDMLMAQGMTSEQFAERLRQDYSLRQVMAGINESAIAPVTATGEALDALFQQREVQVQRFETKDYLAKINPTDAELQAYYKDPANAAQFQAPEQADIEYVQLDLDAVSKGITVPEDELRKYYTENISRYSTPEERRASHILIKADKGASADVKAKAKAKAEGLLAELKKSPEKFAELAKKNSDDPGSAQKGGDLDFFGKGAMVKPFEDAAFSLKPGETSGIIESDFGYHIIRVTEARGGQTKTFEQVRPEIEAEAKKQQAQKRFAESAELFTNTVFEQSDSLKPAADKLKLDVLAATVTRQPAAGATGPLANAKLLGAVFNADTIGKKRNTEAVETGPSQLVSARVLKATPAHQRAYTEVAAQVREAVVKAAATALARKDGLAKLAAGQKDAATALTATPVTVSRAQAHELQQPVMDAVMKADASKLPAWFGVDLGADGYVAGRVTKVLGRDPVAADEKRAQSQYGQAWAGAESLAYYTSLKKRYKAEILAKPADIAAVGSDQPASQ